MSASKAEDEPRRRVPLTWLSWGGLALAPLAALFLLVGEGDGSLRFALVLAIASVALIGLSITLRGGIDTLRSDIEETFLEEIDFLRGDLRNDIATAARATHRSIGERVQMMHDNMEVLRGQVDTVRSVQERDRVRGVADGSGYDRYEMEAPGVASALVSGPVAAAYGTSGGYPQVGSGPAGGRASVPAVSGQVIPRQQVPNGAVRRSRAAQVATRHAGADPRADAGGGGTVYGGARLGGSSGAAIDGEWSAEPTRGRRFAEPGEESWSERRLRERRDDDRWSRSADREYDTGGVEERRSAILRDEPGRDNGRHGSDRPEPGRYGAARYPDDGYGGDRYPSDRYSEARYGDDRREDDPPAEPWYNGASTPARYDSGSADLDRRADEPSGRDTRWEKQGGDVQSNGAGFGRGWQYRSDLPALPSGSDQSSSWSASRGEPLPEREPARRSSRYRDDDSNGYAEDWGPGGGRSRRADYEYTDDRWR